MQRIGVMAVVLFLMMGGASQARFDVIDHGARASGRAGAFVATADDGSALYYNPAGLPMINGSLVETDLLLVGRNTKYESPTGSGEKITQSSVLPNMYAVFDTGSDKWKWGIGVFVPFGNYTEWSEHGPLRYSATYSELKTRVVCPSLGVKLNDSLSVGGGLNIYEGSVISRKMVDYGRLIGSSGSADGFYELISDKEYAVGYNLGLLYQLNDSDRVGISYRSRFDFYFEGQAMIDNIPFFAPGTPKATTPAKARYKLPDVAMFGYSHIFNEKFQMEADLQWTNWSRYDEVFIDFQDNSVFSDTLIRKDYEDCYIYKLGGEYQFNEYVKLCAGYAYSSHAVPSTTFDPSNPSNRRNSVYLGWGYFKNGLGLDVALAATLLAERYVDNDVGASSGTSVDGTYKTFLPQLTVGVRKEW